MTENEYRYDADYHPYYDTADRNKLVAYVSQKNQHIIAVGYGSTEIAMHYNSGWGVQLWTLTVS